MFRRPVLVLALAAAGLPLAAAHAAPRKVIVVTTTAGFRHASIPHARETLAKLAQSSGAFTIVDECRQPDIAVPKKPNKPSLRPDADDAAKKRYENDLKRYEAEIAGWTPEMEADLKARQQALDEAMAKELEKLGPANLEAKGVDGVIFANTTGMLPFDRDGFINWIAAGHAFVAMHSGSDTLHDRDPDGSLKYPGYVDMLQGEFLTHRAQVPADLVAGDAAHPANAGIGGEWDLKQEEMYLIRSQDRSKVRTLWFLRHDPNFAEKAGHFPVSWCRMHGKGRVFYTSLGHREDLWSDDPDLKGRINPVETAKQFQAHILGGIRWALGLAEGGAKPNPEVDPSPLLGEGRSLFNGKDLAGWTGQTEFWSVKDGAITGHTTTEHMVRENTFLIWEGEVGDFELTCKYKITDMDGQSEKFGNSGIQYRSRIVKPEYSVVSGYQADFECGKTYSGILYEEKGRGILAQRGEKVVIREGEKETTDRKGNPKKGPNIEVTGSVGSGEEIQAAIRPADWNEYRIVAKGGHLQHFINGKQTVDVTDETAAGARRGLIALQLHKGPTGMTVQFKDLVLKELK